MSQKLSRVIINSQGFKEIPISEKIHCKFFYIDQ